MQSQAMTSLVASCAILFVLLMASCNAAKFDLQHSIDGGSTFVHAGTIEGHRQSSLELLREPLSGEQSKELGEVVERDGFYILRVATGRLDQSGRPHFVSTSVRATCLATPGSATEKLGLHLSADGTAIMSLDYTLDAAGPCKASHAAPRLPASAGVQLHRPVEGPMVIKAAPAIGDAFGSSYSSESPGDWVEGV